MSRKVLIVVTLAVVFATFANANAASAESSIVEVMSNAGKGFWGLMVRTPKAAFLDVCAGAAYTFSGVTLVLSDVCSLGDRVPPAGYIFDGVISDGLDEFACFVHASGANAMEIGTRRDFFDIPIEKTAFIQRKELFHKEAYRTFAYGIKSFGLAVLDFATGIPANACRMVGLTDAANSITKAADSAAGTLFGTIQWKYKQE